MEKISLKPREQDYATREELKSLRANLQFCGRDKKVVLVTSCMAGEGKSTITLNLALALADLQKKVLLIDADLRKSMLYRQVKEGKPKKGLTHYLSGQAALSDVICTVDRPVFNMIFAGPVPPNPSELLSSGTFAALIEKAREAYDYILIDCAPLGMVIDAALVASKSDTGIIVIESGHIPYRLARNVKEQLEKSGCPVAGVVLNRAERGKGGYYYTKHYRKVYDQYYEKEKK